MIIDDDEVARYVLKTVLNQMDFKFVEAASGREGLQRIAQEKPNVIILDLAMPDVNGYQVLNALKADSATAEIPVIIYTSSVLDSRESELLSQAVAVVSKQAKSREASLENFTDAFRKAGVPIKVRPMKERQHA
jgi:CheY-like chemotaxis protein